MGNHSIPFSRFCKSPGCRHSFVLDANIEPLGGNLNNGELPITTQQTNIAIGGCQANIWPELPDFFDERIKWLAPRRFTAHKERCNPLVNGKFSFGFKGLQDDVSHCIGMTL